MNFNFKNIPEDQLQELLDKATKTALLETICTYTCLTVVVACALFAACKMSNPK